MPRQSQRSTGARQFGHVSLHGHHIGKAGEKGFNRIQNDPFRSDGIKGKTEPHEKTFQVELTRFQDFASFDMHIVESQLITGYQVVKIESDAATGSTPAAVTS